MINVYNSLPYFYHFKQLTASSCFERLKLECRRSVCHWSGSLLGFPAAYSFKAFLQLVFNHTGHRSPGGICPGSGRSALFLTHYPEYATLV